MSSSPLRLLKSGRLWACVIVAYLAAAAFWPAATYPVGVCVAYIDWVRRHYEVKTAGLPAPRTGEYSRLLNEKYGVSLNAVAGCQVSPWEVGYCQGYNDVSVCHLNDKFGRDIFEECWSLAQEGGGD